MGDSDLADIVIRVGIRCEALWREERAIVLVSNKGRYAMQLRVHWFILVVIFSMATQLDTPVCSEPPAIVFTSPWDGAIDAGQPVEGPRDRWSLVVLGFDSDASGMTPVDFAVESTSGAPPSIQAVEINGQEVTVLLNSPIPVGAWTTITFLPSGANVALGHLPGDVNGDGYAGPSDALALIDALNGIGPELPEWATDVDRSGNINSDDFDSLSVVLWGESGSQAWMGSSLPGDSRLEDPQSGSEGQAAIELVPAHLAPYLPGSQVAVEVWLHSMVTHDVLIRLAQLDTSETNPNLTLVGPDNRPPGGNGIYEFVFDYSTLTNTSLYAVLPDYPLPSTVYFGASAVTGRILRLPAVGALRLGTIQGVTMPAAFGSYVLDVMNADLANANFGARLDFGFGQPGDPITTWRAFTGELSGGTYTFIVAECIDDLDCDDSLPCTRDQCLNGTCLSVPDDQIDPDDGLFCNGVEDSCAGGVVIYSSPAPDCDDGYPCTDDACDEQVSGCVHDVNSGLCLIDGDCLDEGILNPANECEACIPVVNDHSWSSRAPGAPCGNSGDSSCCDGVGICDLDYCSIVPCVWSLRSNETPPPRSGAEMAFDSTRGVMVLFGGMSGGSESGETWEWNGITWELRSNSGPSPRIGHAMAFDSHRGVTVLFGGNHAFPAPLSNDTWEWDGTTWEFRSDVGPSGRHAHAMAFDSARGVTVLFGGDFHSGVLGDTWEWGGANWILRSNTGPSNRGGHGMAFDSQRGVTVLFGRFFDTWEWDGNSWLFRTNAGPSYRTDFGMAYDNFRGVTLLFGGGAQFGTSGETWEWDGTFWAPRANSGPDPRQLLSMGFDSVRGVTVLYGGLTHPQVFGDTWELGGDCPLMEACCAEQPPCYPATPTICRSLGGMPLGEGTVCSGDTNGDGLDQSCEGDCDADNVPDGDETDPAQRDCDRNWVCDGTDIAQCSALNAPCTDCDNSGVPDGCELHFDADFDGVIDPCDQCPFAPDEDTDQDGTANCLDLCADDPNKIDPGQCGCGVAEGDSDDDGICDADDLCPGADDTIDVNQDGVPDCIVDNTIPTVGAWGFIVMALILLVVGKIQFGSRWTSAA